MSHGARGAESGARPCPPPRHTHTHTRSHPHKHTLRSAWWASAIGALMSIGYSTIAVALGASQAGNRLGTLGGRAAAPIDKTFGIL